MASGRDLVGRFQTLLQWAEDFARKKTGKAAGEVEQEELSFLVRELKAQQVEQERQGQELRQTEAELRESRKLYAEIYDHAPVGYCTMDSQGTIQAGNLKLALLLGVPKRDLAGSHLSTFIVEADREACCRFLGQLFEKQATRQCELRFRGGNGEPFWALLECSVAPCLNKTGFLLRAVVSDISERKQFEQTLAEREHFLKSVFSSIRDGVSILDRDLNIVEVNPTMEKLYRHVHPLRGRKCYDAYQQRKTPCEICPTRAVLERGETAVEVMPLIGESQEITGWLELCISPLLDAATGELTGLVESVRDITQRRRDEEARRKLEEKISETQRLESLGILAGGIAHDFNNLLMGVLGNADLALMDMPPDSSCVPCVEDVKKAALHLAGLTNQMLAYSGKGRFVVEPVKLSSLLHDISSLLGVSVSKKITVTYELDAELPEIEADVTQVKQLVVNLLANASEATAPEGGVIAVRTGTMFADRRMVSQAAFRNGLAEGEYVYLDVSDNGSGMDPETVKKMFDPFFTTKFTGRGLGLASVLGIMRGHEGGILVSSHPGKGTRIRLLFPPLCPADSHSLTPEQVPCSSAQACLRGTVLLVEDEAVVRKVGKHMLKKIGLEVLLAENGEQAIEVIESYGDEISAVLLDLTMPFMDGLETFDALYDLRPDLPVVLSSGYKEDEAMSRFHGKALAGFVQKPYDMDTLRSCLALVLEAA